MENKKNIYLSLILIFVCISRIIPHPYNFSPVGSIFLISPLLFNDRKWSLTISFLPLIISDFFIGKFIYKSDSFLYDGFLWVYLSYLIIWLYSSMSNQKIITKSIVGSLIFFFVTNASCWINSTFYPQNIYGFTESLIAGIPFYWNTLFGFVFYSGIIVLLETSMKKYILTNQ